MNYEYGSSLANFQDKKFQDYLKGQNVLTEKEKKRLKENLWIKMAHKFAPNNLVVRHYVLWDLFECSKDHYLSIRELLDKLTGVSYVGSNSLYLEGYSYWLYVKPFLIEYNKKFGDIFKDFVATTDYLFSQTAYELNGILYPAPYGDVRHVPLENQEKIYGQDIGAFPLIKTTGTDDIIRYTIKACPIGCNTHVPNNKTVVEIKNGGVFIKDIPFKWYEGYDKKYDNKMAELKDTFSFKRLFSILF